VVKVSAFADPAANLVAVVHIAYFLFIVGGMVAIVASLRRHIPWVRNPWFRIAHIAAIYIVLFEELTGFPCPLNVLQWSIRRPATGSNESSSGVGGLLDYLLYHTISPLALDIMYWSFGALALVTLWLVPPRWPTVRHRQTRT
jgi:uncharacterized protein DUF2784